MPFGLTNATAVFQALDNDVLRDFLNLCRGLPRRHPGIFPDPPGLYPPCSTGTPPPAGEQAVCEGREMRVPHLLRGVSWPHPGEGAGPG